MLSLGDAPRLSCWMSLYERRVEVAPSHTYLLK